MARRMSGQNYSGRIVIWAIRLFLPMTEALEDSASASRRMADVYDVVNAHSAGIGRQYRSGAAEILSGKSAGRNFTDEDLRKLAKEYGDITAAYWSNMKYVFDDREVGRMVRKVS